MPVIMGSTTPATSAHAMAPSTALPPARMMSAPASVDSGCAAQIIPLDTREILPQESGVLPAREAAHPAEARRRQRAASPAASRSSEAGSGTPVVVSLTTKSIWYVEFQSSPTVLPWATL